MKEKTISYYLLFIPVFLADFSASFIVSIHILIKIFKSKLRTIDKKSYWLLLEVKAMFLWETDILLLDIAFPAL